MKNITKIIIVVVLLILGLFIYNHVTTQEIIYSDDNLLVEKLSLFSTITASVEQTAAFGGEEIKVGQPTTIIQRASDFPNNINKVEYKILKDDKSFSDSEINNHISYDITNYEQYVVRTIDMTDVISNLEDTSIIKTTYTPKEVGYYAILVEINNDEGTTILYPRQEIKVVKFDDCNKESYNSDWKYKTDTNYGIIEIKKYYEVNNLCKYDVYKEQYRTVCDNGDIYQGIKTNCSKTYEENNTIIPDGEDENKDKNKFDISPFLIIVSVIILGIIILLVSLLFNSLKNKSKIKRRY